ncbi:MAG TPA: winged helix-turn-helix transcriptional regulator [Candidatus Thermoplasmatota archaeon]|nr:winged helix-turn-helix transcriptional regulator [Candidatus Thermoplasmatota archaeon]
MKEPGTRERIVAIIERDPGINKSGLCERSGLAWGTIHYHLKILQREGRIQVLATAWEALHFVAGLPPVEMAWITALREAQRQELAERIGQAGGLRASELARRLGWSRKVIGRHLTALGRAGVVEKRGERQAVYNLREGLSSVLARMRGRGS